MNEPLHKVQLSVLKDLRHTTAARYSTLMRPTGLQSEDFKFHLRKLNKLGYVEKTDDGAYHLTARGKEFANNLDDSKRLVQQQPKLSILLLVPRAGRLGQEVEYLFQQRRRNPYFGYWSVIGGPAQWGEDFEVTAAKELYKQTGLTAACRVLSFIRQRDFYDATDSLLEDKLFVVMEASDVTGQLSNSWYGGLNKWMTLKDYLRQLKQFESVTKAVEMLKSGKVYSSHNSRYKPQDY